jgi:hypothetical protein
MADKIPVFFGPGDAVDEIVGYGELLGNTINITIQGEQLTRRLPSLESATEIRGIFLGLRYTLPHTKIEVE